MSDTIGETPIEKRPEHDILDSTKIKAFQSCPRQFFFKYILGWQSDTPNIHLAFGSAWHIALEYLHTHGMSDSHVEKAFLAFQKIFNEEFPQQMLSDQHRAKNEENALRALQEYAKTYRHDEMEVLFTETAGTVPIREDRVLHWKSDLIFEDHRGEIWSLEHKTTGRGGSSWKNRWKLDFQVSAYAYALSALFSDRIEDVAGVKINGAILRKSGNNEFVRIPCRKSLDDNNLWLQEANHWIDMIEWNMEILRRTSVEDSTMFAFPRNPTSCTKFGCPFDGLCENWQNPLQHCDQVPVGYEEDHWDPRRQEEEADNVVNLEESDEVKSDGGSKSGDEQTSEQSNSSSKMEGNGGGSRTEGGNSPSPLDIV